MENIYDVLIIGGGVGGMSAAVYAKRSGKNVAIIEKTALGGTVLSLEKIQNFPSQEEIDGFSLSQMFANQVEALGVEIIYDNVTGGTLTGDVKKIIGKLGEYSAKRIILATGLSSVEVGKNEAEYVGRGVSYCAVCDANFFKGQEVCVVSRKGSGIKDAKYLSNIVSKVLVLDEADMTVFAQANKVENMKVVSNARLLKVVGDNKVESVECEINGKKEIIQTSAVFVCLGKKPKSEIFGSVLEVDALGYIKTDDKMKTSVEGVYAVGDVRAGVMKQIVTACGDGAIAGKTATEGI